MRLITLIATVLAFTTALHANGFSTPSRNIVCYIDLFTAEPLEDAPLICAIFEADWEMPPDYDDNLDACDLDLTRIVILRHGDATRARWFCHGDVFWPAPLGALSYGSEWSAMGFTCSIATDGVRCSNETGQSFHLRRAEFTRD